MVEEIRNKWCDDLEDLLQCPICMTRPKNMIYQCVQGHHICEVCQIELPACPFCGQQWSKSRNRLAEHLCTKLEEIKLSLIDPDNEVNKMFIPQTVSVASQTDETGLASEAGAVASKKSPDAHAGAYPCRIGLCAMTRFYEPMLKHLVVDHPTEFQEILSDGPIFQHSWTFDYTEQLIFDRAFLVPDMGTFFLKLSSDVFGNMTAFPLMLHNGFIAKQFTYQLEISCCDEHKSPIYTNEVCSCRTPAQVLHEKCLRVNRKETQQLISHKKTLKCTLLLGRKPLSDQEEDTSRLHEKKKQKGFKNRSQFKGPSNGHNGSAGSSNYQPIFHRQPRITRQFSNHNNPRPQHRAMSTQYTIHLHDLDLD